MRMNTTGQFGLKCYLTIE